MKKFFLIICFFASLTSGGVHAQEVWTLKRCIHYALEHNTQVKQEKNRIEKKQIERRNWKNSYLPNLTLNSSHKFDFGRSLNRTNTYEDTNSQSTSFSLSSEVPLFAGFRISGSVARSHFDLLAAQANKGVIENSLSLNITTSYFQILLNKEILRIAQQQVDLTREQEERTNLLIVNGKVPSSQLFDIKAQLADDELVVTKSRNELRMSALELVQLLELVGTDTFDVVSVDTGFVEPTIHSPESIYQASLTYMPQIESARYALKSGEKSVKVARSGYYPTLSLGAGVSSGYYRMIAADNVTFNKQFRNNMQKSLYLSLSIPLFDRFSTRNKVRLAKVEWSDAQLSFDETKKQLYKEIETAYTDLIAAEEKYAATTKSVAANTEAHRYALEKYAAGKSAVYEYNETKMKLADALSQQAQAKYVYLLKTKILAFYQGEPLID